jgi:hypothetical protein
VVAQPDQPLLEATRLEMGQKHHAAGEPSWWYLLTLV